MNHPENYISKKYKTNYIPSSVLENYSISGTIDNWYRYFMSLGIKLVESIGSEEECDYPFLTQVKYNGTGVYEIHFYLHRKKVNNVMVNQEIPFHVQIDIEKIINVGMCNFIDSDPMMGSIFVSFDYEEYHRNYVRPGMLDILMKNIKNKKNS